MAGCQRVGGKLPGDKKWACCAFPGVLEHACHIEWAGDIETAVVRGKNFFGLMEEDDRGEQQYVRIVRPKAGARVLGRGCAIG